MPQGIKIVRKPKITGVKKDLASARFFKRVRIRFGG